MYRAYGLLQPTSEFALDVAETRLHAAFPDAAVTRNGDQISVVKGDWEIEVMLNAADYVLAESVGLAEKIAGLDDGLFLETCNRRVDVWSDSPDPFVEHLADFHSVIEVLRTFKGVIVVDPKEPALM